MAKKTTKSLLEQAKEAKTKQKTANRFSNEEIELALGWVDGQVSLKQVGSVVGTSKTSPPYIFLALALKQHLLK